LDLPTLEHYFGPCASLEELVARGQFLQSAGSQGLFEEARRQKPVAAMALNWCFNEPWPCAANNSLVSWPCEPKPALAAVARACRPTLASARVRKFSWAPGEAFDPELWLLHDGPDGLAQGTVTAWIKFDGERQPTPLLTWPFAAIPPNTNRQGPRVRFILPEFVQPRFHLYVEVDGHPEWNSTYTLIKAHQSTSERTQSDAARLMNF
jgi:beta-mannosidase